MPETITTSVLHDGKWLDLEMITTDQAEAYAAAMVREALEELDRKLDEAFSKLQSYDKTDEFWEGVGYSAQSATQIINDIIPGNE